jgi:hypothetical protein
LRRARAHHWEDRAHQWEEKRDNMPIRSIRPSALVASAAMAAAPAAAQTLIDDSSFFDPLPHTLLDMETDGNGVPVILNNGGSRVMGPSEYERQGVLFNPTISWVNDQSMEFDQALAIGGSLENGFASGNDDMFDIIFTGEVHAFGAWVVNNRNLLPRPTFTAYDAAGNIIETVVFEGRFVDGNISFAEYGFMGVASERAIARVSVVKEAAMFDDLRFSIIPAPGAGALLALGLLAARRRR